jgi:hypothetical protein
MGLLLFPPCGTTIALSDHRGGTARVSGRRAEPQPLFYDNALSECDKERVRQGWEDLRQEYAESALCPWPKLRIAEMNSVQKQ